MADVYLHSLLFYDVSRALKDQTSALNGCWEQCNRNFIWTVTDRQTHKGKTVYPTLLWSWGIISMHILQRDTHSIFEQCVATCTWICITNEIYG